MFLFCIDQEQKYGFLSYCTVSTGLNLTASGPRKRTRGSLWVCFESAFQKIASALGPLGSAPSPLGVRSDSTRVPLCVCSWGSALRTHVWSGPRSVVTAPCIFQIHCPASSLCSGDRKHTHGKELLLWAKVDWTIPKSRMYVNTCTCLIYFRNVQTYGQLISYCMYMYVTLSFTESELKHAHDWYTCTCTFFFLSLNF